MRRLSTENSQPSGIPEVLQMGACGAGYPQIVPDPEVDGAFVRRCTILLVEDETFVREVTVRVLRSAGYVVLTASTAADACGLHSEYFNEIDLLLSDVVLPDENGCTLARKLRSENKQLLVLFITGYAEQADRMILDDGTVDCLLKPFSARTLLDKIREMIDTNCCKSDWYPARNVFGSM